MDRRETNNQSTAAGKGIRTGVPVLTKADPRQALRRPRFLCQPRDKARICPTCGCIARAYKSEPEVTYYKFKCGAPAYKQSRSANAIEQLRSEPRQLHQCGCCD